eukprot:gene8880-biopygen2774
MCGIGEGPRPGSKGWLGQLAVPARLRTGKRVSTEWLWCQRVKSGGRPASPLSLQGVHWCTKRWGWGQSSSADGLYMVTETLGPRQSRSSNAPFQLLSSQAARSNQSGNGFSFHAAFK